MALQWVPRGLFRILELRKPHLLLDWRPQAHLQHCGIKIPEAPDLGFECLFTTGGFFIVLTSYLPDVYSLSLYFDVTVSPLFTCRFYFILCFTT